MLVYCVIITILFLLSIFGNKSGSDSTYVNDRHIYVEKNRKLESQNIELQ